MIKRGFFKYLSIFSFYKTETDGSNIKSDFPSDGLTILWLGISIGGVVGLTILLSIV